MASLISSGTESIWRNQPQMLKDFLIDDDDYFSSCSSNGFNSFSRRVCCTSVRNLVQIDHLKARDSDQANKLLRSRSKASSERISAFLIKLLSFSFIKPPSETQRRTKQGILPRSLSRKLRQSFWMKRNKVENYRDIKVRVMVKDIIRWKSFRDLIEEKQQQLDICSSPLQISSIAATAASGDDKTSNKGCSAVGEDSEETTAYSVDAKKQGEYPFGEKQQFSPVSVLEFPDEEEEDGDTEGSSSPFQQRLANMERKKQKLMQKIRRFESLGQLEPVDLETRIAMSEKEDSSEISCDDGILLLQENEDVEPELVKLMKAISPFESCKTGIVDCVLEGNGSDNKKVMKVARDWMNGGLLGLGLEVYVREMESEGRRWREFEEEKGEIGVAVESGVLGSLVDELLIDLLS